MSIAEKIDLNDLIDKWQEGCEQSTQLLKKLTYDHLKSVCHQHLQHQKQAIDSTFILNNLPSTTSLLHQSLIELVPPKASLKQQTQFNHYLSIFIRNLLKDEIRKLQAKKRTPVTLLKAKEGEKTLKQQEQFIALDSALSLLEQSHPRKAQVFSMHYFLGMAPEELAKTMEASVATIYRELDAAKAFLRGAVS